MTRRVGIEYGGETRRPWRVGYGILGWDGEERRSNRYGFIVLGREPYEGEARVEVKVDRAWLEKRKFKRVRLYAMIAQARVSTHVGDAGLGIRPPGKAPRVRTVIDIGVGILDVLPCAWDPKLVAIGLRPGDGRAELWLDPRKLYVLHDQTVELYVEPTTDDFTPAPELTCETGAFDNGDGESFQVKKTGPVIRIPPVVEKLGHGMFVLNPPVSEKGQFGRRIEHEEPAKRRGN